MTSPAIQEMYRRLCNAEIIRNFHQTIVPGCRAFNKQNGHVTYIEFAPPYKHFPKVTSYFGIPFLKQFFTILFSKSVNEIMLELLNLCLPVIFRIKTCSRSIVSCFQLSSVTTRWFSSKRFQGRQPSA